ncbi:restriction endonuclease fold toxin 5 domain-containing protein [Burkholderia pseudomallei]|uniref:restriction endonuclease fold toxin 5 domain-containing protein n=1 Tax=Burkholderia pseudomallei TaxID=28450 RepID=UPI001E4F3A91|nr:restriction endonuclease fold toxin 5 domain-containing protein [Burkholderia pseudomallei]
MVFPVIEAAAVELGPILARVGVALLGGATVAGTASLSGDTPKEDSKATPDVRALPRTGESCKKCPPEETGRAIRANHHMSPHARMYQGRVTGRPYSVDERWSEEWKWFGTDFDGFVPAECLLQEAKSRYAKFLRRNVEGELQPRKWFEGFADMQDNLIRQATIVNMNPPARLKWYFEEADAREYMLPALIRNKVQSVVQP